MGKKEKRSDKELFRNQLLELTLFLRKRHPGAEGALDAMTLAIAFLGLMASQYSEEDFEVMIEGIRAYRSKMAVLGMEIIRPAQA